VGGKERLLPRAEVNTALGLSNRPPTHPNRSRQVCVLYPLETIKIVCQSESISAAAALNKMLSAGPMAGVRQLYNGIGAAALCSVIVGSVHYASFCMSKRAAIAATEGSSSSNGSKAGAASGSSETSSSNQSAATAFAAVVGAVATALVESPCDLYRHLAQAGMIQGNFLSEVGGGSVRFGGVGPGGSWRMHARSLSTLSTPLLSRGPPTPTPPPPDGILSAP